VLSCIISVPAAGARAVDSRVIVTVRAVIAPAGRRAPCGGGLKTLTHSWRDVRSLAWVTSTTPCRLREVHRR